MTRRWLILAIAAAALFGMAWWLSLDRLSAKERLLVGTWTRDSDSGTAKSFMRFEPDRRFAYRSMQDNGMAVFVMRGERWFAHDGAVVLDGEPSAVRRAARPVLRTVGLPFSATITFGLESISPTEMILAMPNGTRETWTRAQAD
jgi:hypothetical protein